MPNRLAQSTSPYLLQHADNPVDWWPWGRRLCLRMMQLVLSWVPDVLQVQRMAMSSMLLWSTTFSAGRRFQHSLDCLCLIQLWC